MSMIAKVQVLIKNTNSWLNKYKKLTIFGIR